MKNAIVSNENETYIRHNKKLARRIFLEYGRLYVMSIDRDPISSVSCAHEYIRGTKCGLYDDDKVINTFDELLEDFSKWLETDGYGHTPQRYDANNYLFSYWEKLF